jgi:hypothetical protein
MVPRFCSLLLILASGVLVHSSSWSSMSDVPEGTVSMPEGAVVRTSSGVEAQALGARASWSRFLARHGAWKASWNLNTGTPHRAIGPPIPLPGYADDARTVDRVVRRFIATEAAVFGAPTLETIMCERIQSVWVVRYRQTIRGIPVIFDGWDFRVSASGRLLLFGADSRREFAGIPTQPLVVWAAAREAAHMGVPYDPLRDRVEGGKLVLVPDQHAASGLRLAYEAHVLTTRPWADWNTLVDATSGEIVWRKNGIQGVVDGTVSGLVNPIGPSDAQANLAFPHLGVVVGGQTTVTDAAGHYSASASGATTVQASINGPYCQVFRNDGLPNATFTQNVTAPSTVNIAWSDANSHVAERDVFYHVQRAHDFLKTIEPTYTSIDQPLQVFVNDSGTCQAATGNGFSFFGVEGNGCANYATVADVVAHEYAHFIDNAIYTDAVGSGPTFDYFLDFELAEGFADAYAVYLGGSPLFAQNLYGPGTLSRDLTSGKRWPTDVWFYPYHTQTIWGGALWDLRVALGPTLAAHLFHFAKRAGAGTASDLETALKDFFLELLVQDDDDGNLTNGTPHLAAINGAFDAHGIGTGIDLAVTHTPLVDQAAAGSFPVTATVTDGGTLGSLQGVTLYVSINAGPFVAQAMMPGTDHHYTSTITVGGPALVRYYIRAQDTLGGTLTSPLAAPRDNMHVFLVGPTPTAFADDMEIDRGWTAGGPGDNATSGLWIRAIPVGTTAPGPQFYGRSNVQVQTREDHTAGPGQICFVTGNGSPSDQDWSTQTVKGGKTTLTSPVFSAVGIGGEPAIEYWRWFENYAGVDYWQVSISNDAGTTWVPVENTAHNQAFWRRIAFLIREYVTPTSTMRLRFVAEQRLHRRANVEGAVDDFRLFAISGAMAAQSANLTPTSSEVKLAMAPVTPIPFRGSVTLRYVLPSGGVVRAAIFDASGRKVKVLEQSTLIAGEHFLTWDGRDQNGHAADSGIYFARLATEQSHVVCRLVRVH